MQSNYSYYNKVLLWEVQLDRNTARQQHNLINMKDNMHGIKQQTKTTTTTWMVAYIIDKHNFVMLVDRLSIET